MSARNKKQTNNTTASELNSNLNNSGSTDSNLNSDINCNDYATCSAPPYEIKQMYSSDDDQIMTVMLQTKRSM
jgi:hypothetical protein